MKLNRLALIWTVLHMHGMHSIKKGRIGMRYGEVAWGRSWGRGVVDARSPVERLAESYLVTYDPHADVGDSRVSPPSIFLFIQGRRLRDEDDGAGRGGNFTVGCRGNRAHGRQREVLDALGRSGQGACVSAILCQSQARFCFI